MSETNIPVSKPSSHDAAQQAMAKAMGALQAGKSEPKTEEVVAEATEVAATPAPTPVTPPATPKKSLDSEEFSALAKKERAILQKQKEIQAREAKIEQMIEERVTAKLNEIKKLKPTERLKFVDTDEKSIVDMVINGNELTPDMRINQAKQELESRIAQLESQLKAREEQDKQNQELSKQQAEANVKRDISKFITGNPDKYQLSNVYKEEAERLTWETLNSLYTKNREQDPEYLPTFEEAADAVESYLEELASKALAAPKFKSRLAPVETPAPQSAEAGFQAKKPATPPKTLSNVSSSAPSMLSPKNESDRLQRALAKLNGQS